MALRFVPRFTTSVGDARTVHLMSRHLASIETYKRHSSTTPTKSDLQKAEKMARKFKESPSFGLNIFRGRVFTNDCVPFPDVLDDEGRETMSMILTPTEKFFEEVNDASLNDERGEVPKEILKQLGELGALGSLVPHEYEGIGLNNTQFARNAEVAGANDLALGVVMGAHQVLSMPSLLEDCQIDFLTNVGIGLNNTQYARFAEISGAHDLALTIVVGAHQSIGYKGILLAGTPEQKKKYLPDLATGRKMASFALTEPGAGSDANSIRTRAELSPDGKHYILNGNKIWITNGGYAEVMTVFAQTPVTKDGETKDAVSAFIVERAFGGLTSGAPEKKMGIKASNTTEVHFDNVKVPVENLLGELGGGFKLSMRILNNGRFGIPAAMTGSIRFCMNKAIEHANTRQQFGKKLCEYGDIRRKIAEMAMRHYISESITYTLAGNMDRGVEEFQIEAAIGKVICSEHATWVNDEAIQILGGMGFMRESELERVARDLRIFRIFEGANDILRLFIALTGCQYAGAYLKQVQKDKDFGMILGEVGKRMQRTVGVSPGESIPNLHASLAPSAKLLSECIDGFGATTQQLLIKSGKNVLQEQQKLRRLADAAIDIFSMVTTLSRCSRAIEQSSPSAQYEKQLVDLICKQAHERVNINLHHIGDSEMNARMDEMNSIGEQVLANGEPCQQHVLGV